MEESTLGISDIIAIINLRKWFLIIPAMLIIAASVGIALILPPVYKSESTILIKEQEIPGDYVKASMTSYAEQRIQSINQKVMTSSRLMELIKQFDLYADLKEKKTTDEIIAVMSKDIKLTPVNVELPDPKTGREKVMTIAFTVSYEGRNPSKVQQVVSTITSFYLSEDIQDREKQASETVTFLNDEIKRVKISMNEKEAELSEFKQANISSLPEFFQLNMQTLSGAEHAIEREQERLNGLKERAEFLESQLATVKANTEIEEEVHLKRLEMQLANLKSQFSDQYPDVINTKKEIEKVKAVVKRKKADTRGKPDNPVYISLSSQLSGTRSDMASVREQIAQFKRQADEFRAKTSATPKIEETYSRMVSDINNLKSKYNELQQKMMEATLSLSLQTEQKGERFTLIEPARLPEKPYKPNRLAIVLIGFVLGIGAGVGLAALVEFSDTSFRNAESLERVTGFPVLAEIPQIITFKDKVKRTVKWSIGIVLFAALVTGGLAAFHFYVMDLNVLTSKVMNRLSLMI
ncbi:MAG: chain-length determining protein [Desulfamplus sp.]|nr:chain-length determining protein [Desulfamplus sp.]